MEATAPSDLSSTPSSTEIHSRLCTSSSASLNLGFRVWGMEVMSPLTGLWGGLREISNQSAGCGVL